MPVNLRLLAKRFAPAEDLVHQVMPQKWVLLWARCRQWQADWPGPGHIVCLVGGWLPDGLVSAQLLFARTSSLGGSHVFVCVVRFSDDDMVLTQTCQFCNTHLKAALEADTKVWLLLLLAAHFVLRAPWASQPT